jgi:Endodeoxyribonuclease RusA
MMLNAKRKNDIVDMNTMNVTFQNSDTKLRGTTENPTPKRNLKKNQEPSYWKNESDEISAVIRENEVLLRDDLRDPNEFLKILLKGKFSQMQFTVRGNPQPLRRHRTRGGFIYNPSASAQELFRSIVRNYLQTIQNSTSDIRTIPPVKNIETQLCASTLIIDDHDKNPTTVHDGVNSPIFLSNQQLAMTIVFNMKRPQNHFVSSKRGPGRLRKKYNETTLEHDDNDMDMYPTTASDVDNLAKFVLDSMNGVLYVDDRQVVSLHAIKVFDSSCDDADRCCQGSTSICIRSIESPADLKRIIVQALQ